jgi:RNA polymerase sigma-70 factor (ECF subfamily)
MIRNSATEGAIVSSIPILRGFAISLCRSRDRADELVQETLMRAIAHIDSFQEGSNLAAWLFTILRNAFYNEARKAKWVEPDVDGRQARSMTVLPAQEGWDITEDLQAGLKRLSSAQRQALYLVGATGLSYEEAAATAGCPPGTMKSRVNRARARLSAFMSGERGSSLEADGSRKLALNYRENFR